MKQPKYCKRCNSLLHYGTSLEYCRKCYIYLYNKARREKRMAERRCIDCGAKLKPQIIYHIRCDKHMKKNN
jgi:hypothetical protein